MLLEASSFSKTYGTFPALRNVGFAVAGGEIVGLIGPNGSGKTTLLDAVAGLLDTEAGVVLCDERTLDRRHRSASIFYLPDGIRPWPDQPVGWVLQLAQGLFGGSAAAGTSATERLALDPLLDARMGSLSKGEHKRVMLAIALIAPQPMLMLDEPFDGLDLRQTREVMAILREHAAAGHGIFVSIHQLSDAARVADRLVLLNNGEIVGMGTLDELRSVTRLPGATLEEVFLALT